MGDPRRILDRIVVHDDDPETVQLIRDFLEPLGYLVECVPGIGEASSATDEKP
jgi:DNA-binding response OmpR family regulator